MKHAGVMGWPVEHSLSPKLHTYWLEKYRIDGSYAPLAVPPGELETALKSLDSNGFCGVNLTVPHKEAALKYMDHIDLAARRIGAVNTVLVRLDGSLEGRNTDVFGFRENLRLGGASVEGKPVTVLGAGGAARAVVSALLSMGAAEIRIVNRTIEKAKKIARDFSTASQAIDFFLWAESDAALDGAALLVNATSLGMEGQPSLEISLDALPREAVVTDIVYAPLMTGLLQKAQARGHTVVDGLGMLLHQARPAFEAFFGFDPEVTDDLREFILKAG